MFNLKSTKVRVIANGGLTGDTVNQLTNELSTFTFKIMLKYNGTTTIANSSLGVMSLGVPADADIEISVEGDDVQLQEVISALTDKKFVKTL
ncbi:hypothetical protein TY91_03890 [Secundilactobacillus collinoides]|uniref:HPr domain-containing protein n=1 Tax=Secundilactobacillus collinoides TaxID=33960 RepID=A0A161V7E5_SECCO|nr:hypothetical protein TY91_03890 [Secundilactobacillus collinoides]